MIHALRQFTGASLQSTFIAYLLDLHVSWGRDVLLMSSIVATVSYLVLLGSPKMPFLHALVDLLGFINSVFVYQYVRQKRSPSRIRTLMFMVSIVSMMNNAVFIAMIFSTDFYNRTL